MIAVTLYRTIIGQKILLKCQPDRRNTYICILSAYYYDNIQQNGLKQSVYFNLIFGIRKNKNRRSVSSCYFFVGIEDQEAFIASIQIISISSCFQKKNDVKIEKQSPVIMKSALQGLIT